MTSITPMSQVENDISLTNVSSKSDKINSIHGNRYGCEYMDSKDILHILLVDDDEDEYILLKDLVSEQTTRGDYPRIELDWVSSYEEALAAFNRRAHEAYLVDYNLGNYDGLELLRKAEELGLKAPIIMLTGQGNYEVDVAAMQSGASDYLVKSQINLPLLERSIRYSIEHKLIQDILEDRVRQRTQELEQANQELVSEVNLRRQAEVHLRESEMKFRALANTTSASILIVQESTIRYANMASRFIFGYSPEELVGQKLEDLIYPSYRSIVSDESLGAQWDSEIPVRYELKVVRNDQQIRWVDVTAGRMEFEGNPAWVITAFDITERDLAEQELRKAKAELEVRVEERTADLRKAVAQLHQAATEARQHAEEMEALHTATSILLSTLNLETLLEQILDAAQSAIPGAENGWLHMVEPGTGKLKMRAAIEDEHIRRIHIPKGKSYPILAAEQRKPLLIRDTEAEKGHLAGKRNGVNTSSYRSAIIAPMILNDEVIGVMSLSSPHPDTFTEDDLRLLTSFSVTASAAIHNAMLHAEVQRLAITDTLTNGYNRRAFMEIGERELDRYRRFNRPLAAIMLDIDDFKSINDKHGHAAGDKVLHAVAERISNCIRDVDVLARYGGDEFAILLPDSEWKNIPEISDRIIHCVVDQPVTIQSDSVEVTISLGAAQATPEMNSLDELLDNADKAMYEAKQMGKNRVVITT